jgi:hypothetical protein
MLKNVYFFKDWMDCQWWSSTPARGPQEEPNVHTVVFITQLTLYDDMILLTTRATLGLNVERLFSIMKFIFSPLHDIIGGTLLSEIGQSSEFIDFPSLL